MEAPHLYDVFIEECKRLQIKWIVRDPHAVKQKFSTVSTGGLCRLQLISDFDSTLTPHKVADDGFAATSFGVMLCSISSTGAARSKKLYDKYVHIETDPSYSPDERNRHMVEWWQLEKQVQIDEGFSPTFIKTAVENTPSVKLRSGVEEILDVVEKTKMPMVIFSAGIGDIILEIFDRVRGPLSPNIHVTANFLAYDENTVVDWHPPLVHVFNKTAGLLPKETRDHLMERPHTILLGDSLGDLHMTDGMDHDVVISIGILNYDIERRLPYFCGDAGTPPHFDIVLLGDVSIAPLARVMEAMTLTIFERM